MCDEEAQTSPSRRACHLQVQVTARQSVLRPSDAPLVSEGALPSGDAEVDVLSMIALGLKETAPCNLAVSLMADRERERHTHTLSLSLLTSLLIS